MAEKANLLKSQFLATVSHELRTPLSLIVGTSEMMLRTEPDRQSALPASYRHDLDTIRTGAQHLAHLIGDVLDLASSQAGELHLYCEPLHPNDILAKVAILGEPMAREKGLAWQAVIPPNLPLVWGDRTRLQQVVLNLVSNAIKFTEHGSVTLWAESGKKGVMVAVSDTGHGMNPEVRDRAFDPFFTTKKPGEGTGMGLAVVHGIVKNHEGALTLESEVGKGTTVHVFLPWVQAEEPREYVPSEPIPTGKERILLVDDEEMQVQTLQHMLERLGYRVIGKTSALEALETFRSQPDVFDLVITDQTMPVLTGAELSRELLGLRPDLPIILSTGYSETFDEEEAREEDVREAVRARHRMYYRLYERKLPPEKVNKSPRPPVPGGRGPRLAAHR